jgi:hypothetical protein
MLVTPITSTNRAVLKSTVYRDYTMPICLPVLAEKMKMAASYVYVLVVRTSEQEHARLTMHDRRLHA